MKNATFVLHLKIQKDALLSLFFYSSSALSKNDLSRVWV